MNTRPNALQDHMVMHDKVRAEMREQRDREERKEEARNERLGLDITSIAQQFTGISVICTFIASMTVALISLANDMFSSSQTYTQDPDWSRRQIYLFWYLSLIYSFTTAIASGASAVLAFARANGRIDAESRSRVVGHRDRLSQLIVGFAVSFTISVALLFFGLFVFIWTEQDRSVTVVLGIMSVPLWAWLMMKAYLEWQAAGWWGVNGAEGDKRVWRIWTEFPWSAARWRRTEKEKEIV